MRRLADYLQSMQTEDVLAETEKAKSQARTLLEDQCAGGDPMQTAIAQPTPETQVREILEALLMLPPERIAQVHDYVRFLQERYGQVQPIEHSDSWSEQDIHDLMAAALAHAEGSLGAGEDDDGCLSAAPALG
jgi:hypothetical protein